MRKNRGEKKNTGHDQEDTQIIMMPSENERKGMKKKTRRGRRETEGVRVVVWGGGGGMWGWVGVLLCLNLHPNEGTCVLCHVAKRSPELCAQCQVAAAHPSATRRRRERAQLVPTATHLFYSTAH